MKFNLKQLNKALNYLSFKVDEKETEVEIELKKENIEKEQLCDTLTFSSSYEEEASSWDSNQSPTQVTEILEVFADNERYEPRFTVIKTRIIKT